MDNGFLYDGRFPEESEVDLTEQEETGAGVLPEDLPPPNYVLIDAALWGDDINELFDSGALYRSLFRGSAGLELWSVAPYLADTSTDVDFTGHIAAKDPVDRRVTWLSSPLEFDALYKHFRRFLRVKKEDGSYMYFRFYDPYVVRVVLPCMEQEQLADFFEGIDYLKITDARLNETITYRLSDEGKLEVITTAI